MSLRYMLWLLIIATFCVSLSQEMQSACPQHLKNFSYPLDKTLEKNQDNQMIYVAKSKKLVTFLQMENELVKVLIYDVETQTISQQDLIEQFSINAILFDANNNLFIVKVSGNTYLIYKFVQDQQLQLVKQLNYLSQNYIFATQILRQKDQTKTVIIALTLNEGESQIIFWNTDYEMPEKIVNFPTPNKYFQNAMSFCNFYPISYKPILVLTACMGPLILYNYEINDFIIESNVASLYGLNYYIHYDEYYNVLFTYGFENHHRNSSQMIYVYHADNLQLYKQILPQVEFFYSNDISAITSINGTEFLLIGFQKGDVLVVNFISGDTIRHLTTIDNYIKIESLQFNNEQKLIYVLKLDNINNMAQYTIFDWNLRFIESLQVQNQSATCYSSCPAGQFSIMFNLSCSNCQPECKTCNHPTKCQTCKDYYFLQSDDSSCQQRCKNNLWGTVTNASQQICSDQCQSDIYQLDQQKCGDQMEQQSDKIWLHGVLVDVNSDSLVQNRLLITFEREIFETSLTRKEYYSCIKLKIDLLDEPEYTFRFVKLSNQVIAIDIVVKGSKAIKNPEITIKFSNITCFIDKNGIPLSQTVLNGFIVIAPWDLVKYDEGTVKTAETVSEAAEGSVNAVSSVAFPLFLTNVMFIFWILINVFQILSFLLYINVKYPINVQSFFRAFKAFNLQFLPTFGIEKDDDTQKFSFLGFPIEDQGSPQAFEREGLTTSFYLNGLKFMQTIILLYIALVVLRVIARLCGVNPAVAPNENVSLINKLVQMILNKIEYTLIITMHQSAMLNFTLAIALQFRNISVINFLNVLGFVFALICLVYLLGFMYTCYKVTNNYDMIIGSKIMEKIKDDKLKEQYNYFKIKFVVLYWNLDFVYYFRRNFHFFSMVKSFLIPFVLVAFHDYPYVCISLLLFLYVVNSFNLFFYKPFEKKSICYLYGINEVLLLLVLCIIIQIHSVVESQGNKFDMEVIDELVILGWVIIGLLLGLFLFNIVISISIEWDLIMEGYNMLKQKFAKQSSSSSEHELLITKPQGQYTPPDQKDINDSQQEINKKKGSSNVIELQTKQKLEDNHSSYMIQQQ